MSQNPGHVPKKATVFVLSLRYSLAVMQLLKAITVKIPRLTFVTDHFLVEE